MKPHYEYTMAPGYTGRGTGTFLIGDGSWWQREYGDGVMRIAPSNHVARVKFFANITPQDLITQDRYDEVLIQYDGMMNAHLQ